MMDGFVDVVITLLICTGFGIVVLGSMTFAMVLFAFVLRLFGA